MSADPRSEAVRIALAGYVLATEVRFWLEDDRDYETERMNRWKAIAAAAIDGDPEIIDWLLVPKRLQKEFRNCLTQAEQKERYLVGIRCGSPPFLAARKGAQRWD